MDRLVKSSTGEQYFSEDMGPNEFDEAFKQFVLENIQACWVLEARTKKGFIPVGVSHGHWFFDALLIGDTVWFPWASDRNKIESMVKLINELRKEHKLLGMIHPRDKDFFVYVAKHGIIRRVGTIYDFNPEGPMAMFQSRMPQWVT